MARPRRNRSSGTQRSKPLFVIAAEGRVSERIYFESFDPGRDGRFRIDWVNNPKDKSHPRDVVTRLIQAERDRRSIETQVQYWAVIDRDAWPEADLAKAWGRIRDRQNFFLALSNPCFEFWLYLHLRDNRAFADRYECQRILTSIYDYDKSDYNVRTLREGVGDAINRARDLDENPEEAWPMRQGTQMYRLVEQLI